MARELASIHFAITSLRVFAPDAVEMLPWVHPLVVCPIRTTDKGAGRQYKLLAGLRSFQFAEQVAANQPIAAIVFGIDLPGR